MEVYELPIEIQEKILSMLDVNSLLSAVEASPDVFNAIAKERLFRQFCLKHISEDVLSEMLAGRKIDEVNDGSTWRSFLRRWAGTTTICIADEEMSVPRAIQLPQSASDCISFTANGDIIITSDNDNRLTWYRYNTSNDTIAKLFIVQCISKVIALSPLSVGSDDHDVAIVAISANGLDIYRQSRRLFSLTGRRHMPKVSVEGNRFVTYDYEDKSLIVWQVDMATNDNAEVTVQSELVGADVQEQRLLLRNVRDFYLYKNQLTVLLDGGSLATWERQCQCLQFKFKKWSCRADSNNHVAEFQYLLRSFMYRELTFADVTSARVMLGYWHINMGPNPYWLVSSGDLFKRMDVSRSDGDEISAVCIRLTLVAIGTIRGRVYLYRILEADSQILEVPLANRKPLASINTAEQGSAAEDSSRIDCLELSFGRDCCLISILNSDHRLFVVKLSMENAE